MRCLTCDHPLWKLPASVCPECGTAFKPSDFDFAPRSVHFHCPHCEACYLGTSSRGHLEPREFQCVQCGNAVRMDEMMVSPVGAAAGDVTVTQNPWLNRSGLTRAYFRTIGAILGQPERFGHSLPLESPVGEAIRFFAIGWIASIVLNLISQLVMVAFTMLALGSFLPGGATPLTGRAMLMQASSGLVYSIVIGICWILIEACVCHPLLRGASRRQVTLHRCLQVYLYSGGVGSAVMCAQAIPCCGWCASGLIGIGWFGYSIYVIGQLLRTTYDVTMTRAILTAIASRLISVVVSLALLAGVALASPALLGLPPGIWRGAFGAQAGADLGRALVDYRNANGTWPATPLHACTDDTMALLDLLSTVGKPGDIVSIGQVNTFNAYQVDPSVVSAEAASLARRIQPGRAFRLGPTVFVYPLAGAINGPIPPASVPSAPIPPSVASSDEWLYVVEPSLSSNFYRVVRLSGETLVSAEQFPTTLAEENARRASAGLAPLPAFATLPDLLLPPGSAKGAQQGTDDGPTGADPATPADPAESSGGTEAEGTQTPPAE